MAAAPASRSLIERDRIAEVINTLFVATDTRDWERVRGCFALQVTFAMTSVAEGVPARLSPQEITAGWDAGLRPIESGPHRVRPASDDAECSSSIWSGVRPRPCGGDVQDGC